jgi:hypothetical protein
MIQVEIRVAVMADFMPRTADLWAKQGTLSAGSRDP